MLPELASRGASTPARPRRLLAAAALALGLVACEADTRSRTVTDNAPAVAAPAGEPGETVGNGAFSLRAANRSIALVEGGDPVAVALQLTRNDGFDAPVTLAAEADADAALSWRFSDDRLESGQNGAELIVQLDIGVAPILASERTLRVIATDGNNAPVVSEVVLQVQPTARPDVYLLLGQSNMVGFSQPDARQSDPGEPDAPDARILQLNVTGNDETNFPNASAFTREASLANPDAQVTIALDPLHDGFDFSIDGKAATFIGPGISFAKAALSDTTAEIVLVPGAWSDTGFCSRDTAANALYGERLGWLAQPLDDDAFAGTLLHDRAIARANLALETTGGVLRGILWHQGEADVDDVDCAIAYEANLRNLVASLRNNVVEDARGTAARGPQANVPFVLATMSKGSDARGSQVPFGANKLIVDGAHRNVEASIPFATFSNNDDLVPSNGFPCGEGSCVHFGAAAQREMGRRYYERLRALID